MFDDSRRGDGWSVVSDRPKQKGSAHAALRACLPRASGSGTDPGRWTRRGGNQDYRGQWRQGREGGDLGSSQYRLPHPQEPQGALRSEEHTSELQSLMRISYAVFCLKKTKINKT